MCDKKRQKGRKGGGGRGGLILVTIPDPSLQERDIAGS